MYSTYLHGRVHVHVHVYVYVYVYVYAYVYVYMYPCLRVYIVELRTPAMSQGLGIVV